MGLFDWFTSGDSPQFRQAFRKANPSLRASNDWGPAPAPPQGGLFGVMGSPARQSAAADPLTAQPGGGQGYSSYNPSWRERIGAGIQSGLETAGVSRPMAQDYGGKAETVAGMTPVVGQVLSANEAARAAAAHDPGGVAMGLFSMLPGKLGMVFKKAMKGGA